MTATLNSRISGFHKLSPADRLSLVEKLTGLDEAAAAQLRKPGNLDPEVADHMIENVVSSISMPDTEVVKPPAS